MILRDYQNECVDSAVTALMDGQSTLVVMPTGVGKTICFAKILEKLRHLGRGLVIAHRKELIDQALDKIHKVTDLQCDIEMADQWSYRGDWLETSDVIISSVQTQTASDCKRMRRFDPNDFGLLILDEAHHATSTSWRKLIKYYRRNSKIKILGCTATPDRHDEQALGQIFESVAYHYKLTQAIDDGWLVRPVSMSLYISDLDFSGINAVKGDFQAIDIARLMEYEQVLHEVAMGVLRVAKEKKTLVFAASVAHAHRLAEIFNRHATGMATVVDGKTPKKERETLFRDYDEGRFRILVNVGVTSEGYDCPSIECVAIARPTKSRALFAQMAGRGFRTLPGVVDPFDTPELRKKAIATSGKPNCLLLDFVGNSGKHNLISAADLLGGELSDEIVERAKEISKDRGAVDGDVMEDLKQAEREVAEDAEVEMRRRVKAKKATVRAVLNNPFNVLNIAPEREMGWNKGRLASVKQIEFLKTRGIKVELNVTTFTKAHQLVGNLIERKNKGLCTFKQARKLASYGYSVHELSFTKASALLTEIAKNHWEALPEHA